VDLSGAVGDKVSDRRHGATRRGSPVAARRPVSQGPDRGRSRALRRPCDMSTRPRGWSWRARAGYILGC